MNKYAKGPWNVGEDWSIMSHGWFVAHVTKREPEVDHANAHLLAAAPELLEALSALLDATEGVYSTSGHLAEAETKARDAIDKAVDK